MSYELLYLLSMPTMLAQAQPAWAAKGACSLSFRGWQILLRC